ncbi:MAG: hypothetical protein IJS46_02320 [Kiritimatiellae bacterium]|nr:hypothetical protein [Kiritimatiellia bacterium]
MKTKTTMAALIATLAVCSAVAAETDNLDAELPPPGREGGAPALRGGRVREGGAFERPARPQRDGKNAAPFRRGGIEGGEADRLGFVGAVLRDPEGAEKIGIDREKASALAATLAGYDKDVAAANGKLRAAMKKQAEAIDKAAPDEAEVMAAVNEVWDIRRDIALVQTKKLLAVKNTLTAEQIAAARKVVRQKWESGGNGPRGRDRRVDGGRRPERRPEGAGETHDGPRGDAPPLPPPEVAEDAPAAI